MGGGTLLPILPLIAYMLGFSLKRFKPLHKPTKPHAYSLLVSPEGALGAGLPHLSYQKIFLG